ncbi:hypothetical protein ACWDBF_16955 [Streptomyces angustmyceticus]
MIRQPDNGKAGRVERGENSDQSRVLGLDPGKAVLDFGEVAGKAVRSFLLGFRFLSPHAG